VEQSIGEEEDKGDDGERWGQNRMRRELRIRLVKNEDTGKDEGKI
jgi:hypothetical protein